MNDLISVMFQSGGSVPMWLLCLLLIGSITDLFQFVWLLNRWYRKLRRRIAQSIKQMILDGYEKK